MAMRTATPGFEPSDIGFGSSRILFVEGEPASIDARLLSPLLPELRVKGVGPSMNIKAAAEAFAKVHPAMYFLVDRDHQGDSVVEKTWNRFEEGTGNLIIWRKKEIENYFLDPKLLCASEFLKEGVAEEMIRERIIDYARSNIYMFVANRVVVHLREELKAEWIKLFKHREDFPNAEAALSQLLNNDLIKGKPCCVKEFFSTVPELFHDEQELMMGDGGNLEWGKGRWLDLMPGKDLLHMLLNDGKLFDVVDKKGRPVQGAPKRYEIMQRLLVVQENWPDDFKSLKQLLTKRANSGALVQPAFGERR